MRIYTEVIFEWDDKQNQLVETSSESFDYEGEMALCAAWERNWFWDSQGNKYLQEIKYQKKLFVTYAIYSRLTNVSTGELKREESKDVKGMSYHREIGKSMVRKISYDGTVWSGAEANKTSEWAENYKEKFDFLPSGVSATDLKFANLRMSGDYDSAVALEVFGEGGMVSEEYWTWEPTEPLYDDQGNIIDTSDFEGDITNAYMHDGELRTLEEMEGLVPGFDPANWEQLEAGEPFRKKPDEIPLDLAARESSLAIDTAIADWKAITDPTVADEFQDEIEAALRDIGWAEEDIITEFEKLTGTEGEFEKIKEDWETASARLTGEAVYDKEGNLISEGTFTTGMREALEAKIKSKEDIVTTREEQLETLREEGEGGIRAAEAKIGAAGFAATGVGRTARDVLAEEIGEEARGIDIGFTEDIEDVEEGYLTKTEGLITGKETALEDYESERDVAAKDVQATWEELTTAYGRKLEDYGAVKGGADYTLEGVLGGKETQAEVALQDIQVELQDMIRGIHLLPGQEEWDPFSDPQTILGQPAPSGAAWADILGWSPISKTFDPGITAGLFRPTIEAFKYEPTKALQLFDPDEPYEFDWESEGFGGSGTGDEDSDKQFG